MKVNNLLLESGEDIPFIPAKIPIHQPRMYEIGFIGENRFLTGVHFLNFSKDLLSDEDKIVLKSLSDFQVMMTIMTDARQGEFRADAYMIFTLLFPDYEVNIQHDKILLQTQNFSSELNSKNYVLFKNVLQQMFCLTKKQEEEYNPADGLAQRIAKKIKKSKERLNKRKDGETSEMFDQYISILAVGLGKSKRELMQYTVHQLLDEYERYQAKVAYDMYVSAKLAGATDLQEVEHWMKIIHA